MTTKKLLSIAIIAALPFGANANDPVVAVGPAHANSNVVVATASAPYVTVTPSAADESHIATTAYVKGAYNDSIAAVNKVANDVSAKQGQLVNPDNNHNISTNVISNDLMGNLGYTYTYIPDDELASLDSELVNDGINLDDSLITAKGVFNIMRNTVGTMHTQEQLVLYSQPNEDLNVNVMDKAAFAREVRIGNAAEAAAVFDTYLVTAGAVADVFDSQRVDIYTTWDNDNATTQVQLSFVPPAH